ncbi:MAG: MBL fold metallo-hydrolase [Acidimicrobiia bacterium]
MDTKLDEIADGVYRISTWVEGAGLVFNQFLLDADEPLLFHTGLRALFPLVSETAARVVPLDRLRWISFGHVEADECGSMNQWLDAAPNAELAHTNLGVLVSVADLATRPPRGLADDEIIDLGGKRVRHLATPHVPHGWDAGLLFEEVTGTLLASDLFTASGQWPAVTDLDLVEPALAAEDLYLATALTPATAPTVRRLAGLAPQTLALMHGPAYTGDGAGQLLALADAYDARLHEQM